MTRFIDPAHCASSGEPCFSTERLCSDPKGLGLGADEDSRGGRPLRAFVCYAREDEDSLALLMQVLRPLEHEGLLSVWSDKSLLPGEAWDEVIQDQVSRADLFLILVSRDALASDYMQGRELALALAHRVDEGLRIVPIIVRGCDWRSHQLGYLQALPSGGRPIAELGDEGWSEVSVGMRVLVQSQRPSRTTRAQTRYLPAAVALGGAVWLTMFLWMANVISGPHGLGTSLRAMVPFAVVVVGTLVIYFDSRNLRRHGLPVRTGWWTVATLVLLLGPLPVYVCSRRFLWLPLARTKVQDSVVGSRAVGIRFSAEQER